MYPTSAFDEFLLLQDQRNSLVYEMGIAGAKLKKAIKDLAESRASLDSMCKSNQTCLATRDFLLYEAKVVLLSEYDRVARILNSNKTMIPETRQEIVQLERLIKGFNKQISVMNEQLKQIDKKMSQFGKVVEFNANRQETPGE